MEQWSALELFTLTLPTFFPLIYATFHSPCSVLRARFIKIRDFYIPSAGCIGQIALLKVRLCHGGLGGLPLALSFPLIPFSLFFSGVLALEGNYSMLKALCCYVVRSVSELDSFSYENITLGSQGFFLDLLDLYIL